MGNSAKPRGLGMSELWIANREPCANLKPRNEYKWPNKHVYAMNPSTSSNIPLASTEKRHCIGSRHGCWTQCKPPLKNAGWFAISTPWHTRNDWNILKSWKSPLPSFETTFIARFKKVTHNTSEPSASICLSSPVISIFFTVFFTKNDGILWLLTTNAMAENMCKSGITNWHRSGSAMTFSGSNGTTFGFFM